MSAVREHMSDELRLAAEDGAAGALEVVQLLRLRRALEASCSACPERESKLRRELLCRCPVALSARLVRTAERQGCDLMTLPTGDRLSLQFQQRATGSVLPPADPRQVGAAADQARELSHAPCLAATCMLETARGVVLQLESRLPPRGEPA